MKYESLAELIEPYADGPFNELPEGLGERVARAFSPVAHWNGLTPNRRRQLARQHDNHNDPANRRENEYYFALVSQLQEAESQKLKWELLAPQNITEADIKEKKLSALAAQLDALQKQIDAPYSETPDTAPVVQATETKEQRQDRRLKACIDAGLPMGTKAALLRLPDGVGDVADRENVTRQAFSTDVKAALKRRESSKREGVTVHRA